MLRHGTALAVLLLLLAPVVGRISQHLGRGSRVRHQLTFSRSGHRPPARVIVVNPQDLPAAREPALPDRVTFVLAPQDRYLASTFVDPHDGLRGPPRSILL